MRANELRIGNYLFVPGIDREVIVSAMFKSHYVCEDSDGIRFDESLRINYQPISLTEQWLLKLGFEKHPNDIPSYAKIFGNFNGDDFEYAFCVYQDSNGNFYAQIIGKKIVLNSVHQLQNLYFALTGEELINGGKK